MARARNIKPGFFTNEELAEVEPLGRILFAGLWTIADRDGRLGDRPKKIKVEILPYDQCNVDEMLQDLADRGFILRYQINGDRYIQILAFAKHQNPHKNEKPSYLPPPPSTVHVPDKHSTSTVQALEQYGTATVQVQDNSSTTPEKTQTSSLTENEEPRKIKACGDYGASTVQAPYKHSTAPVIDGTTRADSFNLIPDSLNMNPSTDSLNSHVSGEKSNSETDLTGNLSPREGNPSSEDDGRVDGADGAPHGELSAPDRDPQFMAFWNAYPKKAGKVEGYQVWKSLLASGVKANNLIIAAGKYAFFCKANKVESQFIKYLPNFLEQGTYLDHMPSNKQECPHCRGVGWVDAEEDDGYGGKKMVMVPCKCREVSAS